ncbi:MAG: MATE family efflux transporter [Nitrospirae bacterium]|nr:MATE family efflux transporter [Nitrospirota bacterium]
MPSNEHALNLTAGNLWLSIWQLSWPMLLIMIFNFFVGLTDVYVAGFISPGVQAVVGFVSQIFFLNIIIANAISIGTIALLSRSIGAGDFGSAVGIARQSLIFGIMAAIVLTMPGLVFYREIVAAAGFPENIRPIAGRFVRIFALSLGPNYILIISNAVFRAGGEVKKVMFTMLVVSAANIAGNFALVFGIPPFPKLGDIGIALSTALSVTAGMAINFALLAFSRWKAIFKTPITVSGNIIRKVISLSWPAALLQIAWNSGSIVLFNILGRLGSASIPALASLANGLRIEAIIYLPAFALNMAAGVIIGQNLGAKDFARAEEAGWKMVSAGIVLVSVMAFIIFIRSEQFASIVTSDPSVLKETARYLRFNMMSEPFMALSVILGGGLQGAGDTRGTMLIIVIAMWVIRLPLAWLLALGFGYGALGVWTAMVTSMVIQGILMAYRFHGGLWKNLTFK